MSDYINKKTFVGLTYNELSQEGFGLPSIRSLRVPDEDSLWKSPLVLAAVEKAKSYASKHGYTYKSKVADDVKESYIKALLVKRGCTRIDNEVLAAAAKAIDFKVINGMTIMTMQTDVTESQKVALGVIFIIIFAGSFSVLFNFLTGLAAKAAVATLNATSNVGLSFGVSAVGVWTGGFLSATVASKLGASVMDLFKKAFAKHNKVYHYDIFGSWVVFNNAKMDIILKQFCNCIIDKDMAKGAEGLEVEGISSETDEVSMNDLVTNETDPVENPSNNVAEDTTPTQTEDNHNELASAGGAPIDNASVQTLEPTAAESEENWMNSYSFEGEEPDICMDCLVKDETDTVEDAGKDSKVVKDEPTTAEDAHNEAASAGGVVAGANEKTLESTPTSEENWMNNMPDTDNDDRPLDSSVESLFNFD